jgi:hypothetical protein
MSREALAAIARRQGLAVTARLIEEFKHPDLFARKFPDDVRLSSPPHDDPLNVLGQMTRRGLDPYLIPRLLKWFEQRPLERGLLAWDALSSTLIPDGEELDRLRAAALPFKDVLPAPGHACVDLNAHPAQSLVPGGHEDEKLMMLFVLANEHSLQALAELKWRKDKLVERPGTHASLQAVGRLLQLAHAPTLSSVYLDYLSRPLGFRPAARDLCEVMFDAGASQRIPADGVRPGDLPPELMNDYGEYLTYRAYLGMVEPQQLYALIEDNFRKRPPKMKAPSGHLQVVRAHVHTLVRKPSPLSLASIEKICSDNKTWRYAARVKVVLTAQLSPPKSPLPLGALHDYVTAFGNDFATVYEALYVGPVDAAWKQEVLPLLTREARGLPHEAGVWRAMANVIGDRLGALEASQEIKQRLEKQSQL